MSVHIYRVVRNATYCQKIDATAKRILILTVDHESHRYVEWVSMQCSSLPYCRSWLKKPVSNSTVDRELELLRMTVIRFSHFEVTMNYDELAIICQNFLCQEVDEVPIRFKRFKHNPQSGEVQSFLWASITYVLGNKNVSHAFTCTAQSSFRQRSGKDSFMSAVIVGKAFDRIFRLYDKSGLNCTVYV